MQLNKLSFLAILAVISSMSSAYANTPSAEHQPITPPQSPAPATAQVDSTSPNYRLNATTLAQLEDLKEQIKSLRGDVEQLQFDNARLNEKIVKFAADVEFRFSEASKVSDKSKEKDIFQDIDEELDNDLILDESDGKKASKQKTKTKDTSVDKKIKEKSEQEQYDDAYTFIKQKKYKEATDAFKVFVEKNPDTDLAGNAHYWLGEIFFMNKAFDKAAVEYLKGYQASIRGSRAADNLLKLGKSLSKLEKRKEACTTFSKLKKEFPNASSQIKKQNADEMKSIHCS